ncbi:MAG: hypothetical protein U0236_08535 [Nitrospira sp.]
MTPESDKSSCFAFFNTAAFWEKIVLLVVTALVSGIVIPLILKQADESRARRAAIVAAQEQLYREASETMLTLQTLALDVSWYGTSQAKDEDNQRRAYSRYSDRVVELVARWRVQIARAKSLTSPDIANKLAQMLHTFFKVQDTPMVHAWKTCSTKCDWEELHQHNEVQLGATSALIEELARDLGLIRESPSK